MFLILGLSLFLVLGIGLLFLILGGPGVKMNLAPTLLDHVAEDYIQHNPTSLSGRDESLQSLAFISPETVTFNIRHSGIDGEFAWVFSRLELAGQTEPTAAADFLRFNGSCIQEHWDVLQQRPTNRTNPLDMW
ncbi:hypothetical protein B0J13DRAFT_659824 [Dactylonectria estremocensis]|uniref:Uncharacterized protein n=1 Tax=Dactylonectria estremocensis TaxID=1079267 RepID=A0A9P9I8A7_9HYPO|nr:hypothetical protein B0J13DRAFT_659824 [Dactylonectria estremocensis]